MDFKEFQEIANRFHIFDARKGGLVLGRYHRDNGVLMAVFSDGDNVAFQEMEGYEYLINFQSATTYKSELDIINKHLTGFQEYSPPEGITVIDVRELEKTDRIVLLLVGSGQFIVNKHATKQYLSQLEHINSFQ